jgi:hypothetical protein
VWCKDKGYNLLVERLEVNDVRGLPSGNFFFSEGAYVTIANKLQLHFDRNASLELKRALATLYAKSFAKE